MCDVCGCSLDFLLDGLSFGVSTNVFLSFSGSLARYRQTKHSCIQQLNLSFLFCRNDLAWCIVVKEERDVTAAAATVPALPSGE